MRRTRLLPLLLLLSTCGTNLEPSPHDFTTSRARGLSWPEYRELIFDQGSGMYFLQSDAPTSDEAAAREYYACMSHRTTTPSSWKWHRAGCTSTTGYPTRNATAFDRSFVADLLQHELGHAFGFRHENVNPVTPADCQSQREPPENPFPSSRSCSGILAVVATIY
jgi:hypothetical protein